MLAAACCRFAWYTVGSIWSRNSPLVTSSPSRTAIRVIRPVMSALMSTFFLGWILPLAVTAATRSRCPTFSNRTSAPRSRRAPALITTSPAITTATPAPTSTLPRFDMFAPILRSPLTAHRSPLTAHPSPQRPAHRRLEGGHRLVIIVHGADVVALRPQRRHLGVEQLEKCSRADAVALGGELQLLAPRDAIRVLDRHGAVRRHDDEVGLVHVGLQLEA